MVVNVQLAKLPSYYASPRTPLCCLLHCLTNVHLVNVSCLGLCVLQLVALKQAVAVCLLEMLLPRMLLGTVLVNQQQLLLLGMLVGMLVGMLLGMLLAV